jgi:predicted transposase
MQRTICLKLNPTIKQTQILQATLASFTTAFNFVSAYGWQHTKR